MTDNPSGGPAPAPPVPPIPPSDQPRWEPAPAPPAPPAPPDAYYPRRRGVGLGIAFIVIGMAFLASWFVPGLAWWTLWPLLIVVVGFVQLFTPSRRSDYPMHNVFDGIGTILFGGVLLGCTTGYISWSMWWVLLTLWPVLIIAAGVAILGRGVNQTWLRALAPVVIWLAVLYAASVSLTGQGGVQPVTFITVPSGQTYSFSEPVNGVTRATLNLDAGAGDISMRSGTDLVAVKSTSALGKPTFSVLRSGDSADVSIGLGNGQGAVVVWPGTLGGHMDVAMSDSVLWDATVSTGASNLDADMSSMRVSRLTLKSGAASATLRLGAVPEGSSRSDAVIKSGVSSVTILVPRDAQVRVDTHNGLTTTSLDSNFLRQTNGVWETAGYSSASKTWNISVESGVSTVSIRTY